MTRHEVPRVTPPPLDRRGLTHIAQKAEGKPPIWLRDSVTLKHLMRGAWNEVSPDTVKRILAAFRANDPKTIEKLLKQLKGLGNDFTEALGNTPAAVYSNLLLKSEAFWKLHAKDVGVDKPKTILEKYRENTARMWGEQIKAFAERYPERILHPEITRQLEYLIETKTPSALQIDGIVEQLERTLSGEEYFKGLSDVQVARAWHADGITRADRNGIVICQVVGPVDGKTCPVCINLVGVEIEVAGMLEKIDRDLGITDPDEYVAAWTFPRLDDIEGVDRAKLGQLLMENGWLPGFHPHCRHGVAWLFAKEETETPEVAEAA